MEATDVGGFLRLLLGQASVGLGPNSRSCCSHSQVTKPTQILTKEEESLGRRYHCGQPKERLQGNLAG